MKKLISVSLAVLLVLVLGIAFVGCSDGDSDLVGTWEMELDIAEEELAMSMTFRRNGTVSIVDPEGTSTGTWRVENGYLFIHEDDCCDDKEDCGLWLDEPVPFSIDGRTMTIESEGITFTLTRR